MTAIKDFVAKFGINIALDESLIIKNRRRYFLLNEKLKRRIQQNFYYAGIYLGKLKNSRFFPSFPLLTMIAEGKVNKTVVNEKTAWLFICGRDIFQKGVLKLKGTLRKGEYTLILNEYNECLGFGKILQSIRKEKDANEIVVKNLFDIGDFLRREKRRSRQR